MKTVEIFYGNICIGITQMNASEIHNAEIAGFRIIAK
jgi:hypothetical protein